MALWKPKSGDPVGPNEQIGRRLFDRQNLKGVRDQQKVTLGFELYHFEEERDGGDISVDRLGQTSIDARIHRIVEARAKADAERRKPARTLLGWAVVKAKELQRPVKGPEVKIVASPVLGDGKNELSDNPYHAHIERPDVYRAMPKDGGYTMAMHLKTIFDSKFHHLDPLEKQDADGRAVANSGPSPPRLSTAKRVWMFVRGLFMR